MLTAITPKRVGGNLKHRTKTVFTETIHVELRNVRRDLHIGGRPHFHSCEDG